LIDWCIDVYNSHKQHSEKYTVIVTVYSSLSRDVLTLHTCSRACSRLHPDGRPQSSYQIAIPDRDLHPADPQKQVQQGAYPVHMSNVSSRGRGCTTHVCPKVSSHELI
jgi:hypothetical protein